jgi:uncharacterized protein YgiM (DUF1202 family)
MYQETDYHNLFRQAALALLALSLFYLLPACSAAVPQSQALSYLAPTTPPTVTPTPTDPATATPEQCTVQTGMPSGYLNLRTGAGTHYPVARVLVEGEVLTVIARGAWLEVEDKEGNSGFVNSRYCK